MVVRATEINPEMLRWARERAGYSVEDIARRRRVPPERVLEWETGKSFPTWKQLEQLAYKDYHRGTVLFFLNDPPEEKTVAEHFPRLPTEALTDLHPDTLYAVRQARIRQDDLAELLGPDGTGERFILRDLQGQADAHNPHILAATVQDYLNAGFAEGKPSCRKPTDAFTEWRECVEDAGVWVFKRSFRQKDIAGFCLGDDVYPVIYVSHGQPQNRQLFALFNGLAHLLFDFNYLERADQRCYAKSLPPQDRSIEETCQEFAKEFTSTDNGAPGRYYSPPTGATPAADQYVSGRRGYYDLQKAYLGRKYIKTVFAAFDAERIDELDIASYLGVRGIYLDELEDYAWQQ